MTPQEEKENQRIQMLMDKTLTYFDKTKPGTYEFARSVLITFVSTYMLDWIDKQKLIGNFELSGKGNIVSQTQIDILEAQKDIDLWNDGIHSGESQDLRDRITLTRYKYLCNLLYIRLNEIYGTLPVRLINDLKKKESK